MRTQRGLENKLDAYENTARADRPAGKTPRRKWRAYAAAAGSGLALTTSAEASIIYSGSLNKSASVGSGIATWQTNINGVNFIGRAENVVIADGGRYFTRNSGVLNGASWLRNGSGNVKMLASGAKISNGAGNGFGNGSGNLHQVFSNTSRRSATHGTWANGATGFAGIKVDGDLGWAELKFGYGIRDYASLTLLGWAYETEAGQSINAGEMPTAAVPEPSTGLMALLATGCVGVSAWRKRRVIRRQGATV
jgi:hypothetical protein